MIGFLSSCRGFELCPITRESSCTGCRIRVYYAFSCDSELASFRAVEVALHVMHTCSGGSDRCYALHNSTSILLYGSPLGPFHMRNSSVYARTASVRVCSWNCSCPICSRSAIIEIELDLALGTAKIENILR